MTSAAASVQAVRSDARRNRALVLAAAYHALAERGTGVSLAEIARRAGVGAGTVYRHFPTKTDLLEAVMQQRIECVTERARAAVHAADVGAAFFEFCAELVLSAPRSQAICDLTTSDDGWPRALMRSAGDRFRGALADLLAAAQHAGAVRPDLSVRDVQALFTGAIAIQRTSSEAGTLAGPARMVLEAMHAAAHPSVTKVGPAPIRPTTVRNERRNENDVSCPVCDGAVRYAGHGRPARYCSSACRQKAHRLKASKTNRMR
ncbi:MAG: TetR/AcrR family transcriptional regulator [Mycobacteriaceae bacterium]|nr:TetR/AcrR family transcriptional regulator [Mycobacteriaceae bacterium]